MSKETKLVTAIGELNFRVDGEKVVINDGATAAIPVKIADEFLAMKAAREPTEQEAALAELIASRRGGAKKDDGADKAETKTAEPAKAEAKPAADAKAADAKAAEPAKAETEPATGGNPADAIG